MKSNIKLHQIIILIIVTAIISGLASGVIVYSSFNKNAGISYKTINNDDALKQFLEVYSTINDDYYENIDKTKMIEAAIDGMLKYLDDNYTTYMTKDESNMLHETLAGEYQGIGVIIENRTIKSVFETSPAEKAGIQIGDEIIKVNDEDVTSLDSSAIANKIKTSTDKNITISIKRNNEEKRLMLEISTLYIPAISKSIIDGTNIGYLELATFSSSVTNQVNDALKYFEDKKIDGLIIDLRSNTGGFLSSAEGVSSLFLKKGKVIYSLESKNSKKEIKDLTKSSTDYPIVVLVNGSTASAAEIVAAALKDSYGAKIVGTKSYGKGKVQQTITLSDGSMAKFTSAKWLRPNGSCIDTKGIEPDYKVELDIQKDSDGNIINIIDTQLDKAVELLSS
jgi:carboxyl-terminal processing protease